MNAGELMRHLAMLDESETAVAQRTDTAYTK